MKAGERAPDVSLADLEGRTRSLREMARGGRLLLVFLRHLG